MVPVVVATEPSIVFFHVVSGSWNRSPFEHFPEPSMHYFHPSRVRPQVVEMNERQSSRSLSAVATQASCCP
jgi:hypothetical protein